MDEYVNEKVDEVTAYKVRLLSAAAGLAVLSLIFY